MNLFAQAQNQASKKKTASKKEKLRLKVDDPEFFNMIEQLQELNERMKTDKSKADLISSEVKEISKEKWAEYYQETGKNPGSVMIESKELGDTAQVMFVPQDKYITIDNERAKELIEEFGEDVVETDTQFSFDNTMIQKYGEVLSRLISECEDIEDDDKGQIIKAVVKHSVAKGTINNLSELGDVQEVMESIRPVVMLKTPEVIRG